MLARSRRSPAAACLAARRRRGARGCRGRTTDSLGTSSPIRIQRSRSCERRVRRRCARRGAPRRHGSGRGCSAGSGGRLDGAAPPPREGPARLGGPERVRGQLAKLPRRFGAGRDGRSSTVTRRRPRQRSTRGRPSVVRPQRVVYRRCRLRILGSGARSGCGIGRGGAGSLVIDVDAGAAPVFASTST